MATSPAYAAVPNNGGLALANADGTTATTFFTAGSSGSRVSRISVYSGPTTAPGSTAKCVISLGSQIIDIFTIVNTADVFQYDRVFDDLLLEASQTLTVAVRTTLTSGATLHAVAFGADL